MSRSWFFLSLAIVSEIVSVVIMKLVAESNSWGALIFMYFTIGLSFTCMAFALKKISLSVAYATWESLGLIAVAVIGSFFFHEYITLPKLVAILMLLTGVLLVNFVENESKEAV